MHRRLLGLHRGDDQRPCLHHRELILVSKYDSGGTNVGAGSLADASTTVKGKIEIATNGEVQTGTDTVRAVTPAGLQACTGTTTRKGVLELATNTEVQTGTDTARAITPAGLQACTSTTTRAGVVELATTTEAKTGTDSARAVTPEGLLSKVNELVKVSSNTTLTASQSGAVVYVTGGLPTLPSGCAEGTHFTIINNKGAQFTVQLNGGSLVTGLPNADIGDHMSKTFICVALSSGTSTWAVIG